MQNVYLKAVRAINPEQGLDEVLNIKIVDGIIAHCSTSEASIDPGDKVIDASEYVCAPGFFDMSVNLNEPGYEHNENIHSGTQAAANGGFTGVMAMPATKPSIGEITGYEFVKNKSKNLPVDVEVCSNITQNQAGTHIAPLMELHDAGVKMFADYPNCIQNAEMMRKAFDYASSRDSLLAQLPYDEALIGKDVMNESELSYQLGLKGFPRVAEEMVLYRDLRLAEYTGNSRYHALQISTKNSVDLIRRAKAGGVRVSASVTPYHIKLTEHALVNYNSNYKIKLPLRTEKDIKVIIEGIKTGVIDTITSDHRPFAQHLNDVEMESAPFGISGLETTLGLSSTILLHENNLDLADFIKLFAINPRKILQLDLIKIKEGEKANLTIFAPNESWNVSVSKFRSKSVNNPFNGSVFKGKQKFIINNNHFYESTM